MSDNHIQVMTLNLRFGLADDGPNGWEFRRAAYPPLFERHRPGMIAFQEANDFQIDDLKTVLTEYRVIGRRRPAPRFWQNNVIFYHPDWQCTGWQHLFLSPTPTIPSRARESRWPRQCTIGVFTRTPHPEGAEGEAAPVQMACITTHFDFGERVQIESAELIRDRMAALPAGMPIVLMGDFNAEPGSACHRAFARADREPGDGAGRRLKSAFTSPYPGTYHGFRGIPDGRHIDWILYSGALEIITADVLTGRFGPVFPSDHYPLTATFRFQ